MNTIKTTKSEISFPKEFDSAMAGKCPRCRTGDMFEGPLFSFGKKKMREKCLHCDLKFEKEPGYFYVAMFISYAFVVAQLITVCVGTYILTGNLENPWLYLVTSMLFVLILAPFNYRYSRIVLMYWLTPQYRFKPAYYERLLQEKASA